MRDASFWQDPGRAQERVTELNNLKTEIEEWENLSLQAEMLTEGSEAEIISQRPALERAISKLRRRALFSGQYDKNDALLEIFSGAGGVDAQDWANMLLRMYQRYTDQHNFSFKILHQSWGEQKGTKSVTAEIRGKFAYGYLRRESGVHRLVRISPFSSKNLRHTSFALVEVLPLTESKVDLKIKPEDLQTDTFRSSGPGGQNVNKLETAVRVTHLPTGLSVAVQSERSQSQNRGKALAVLYSRLIKMMEEKKVEEVSKLKSLSEPGGIEWGSQIRSYVLHPYKLVKDHRTGVESTQPEKVLEGELGEFIMAELDNSKIKDQNGK